MQANAGQLLANEGVLHILHIFESNIPLNSPYYHLDVYLNIENPKQAEMDLEKNSRLSYKYSNSCRVTNIYIGHLSN
ncbi:hypothetical protein Bhyg_04797 [Pseudolycoriella hygida]|uniref:Uncharacterized protein n=1 Tax=Pseudolycoriella hygida TaxID=35572 RepID=A0A9Q0NG23_9DIPT|nr:hypothetical protein Bhyg_04797 [Pseudolycoriella hygida]